MTVIRLLTAQPEKTDKAGFFFGIFPFFRVLAIPYDIHPNTLEKRTSTLKKMIFAHSLTPVYASVKRFSVNYCIFSEKHLIAYRIHILKERGNAKQNEGSGQAVNEKMEKREKKAKKELTEAEKRDLKMKYEIAQELGLLEKVEQLGWKGLTSRESGRIGGIMGKRKREERMKK